MHYLLLVILEDMVPVESREAVVLHRLVRHSDCFDWFQLGARWTGLFDGYDPGTDDSLLKVCWLCKGTGERKDMIVAPGCNGCSGTGKQRKWPTEYPIREGDMAKICDINIDLVVNNTRAIIDMDGKWNDRDHHKDGWHRAATVILESHKGNYVAIVDCHV